ncbi:MAG: lamin tail domain-containing protein, partial [Planctomycetota bacterium]
ASFNTAYPGFAGTIGGVYSGSLDNSGEQVVLEDAVGTAILDFKYKDGWYGITDGGGFSLTLLDSSKPDLTRWSDKDSWAPSTVPGGTPGGVDTGPKPGDIVINEILAHSDTVAYDWIELYNTTASPIDIGGWFLSDTNSDDPNLMKYEIAAGQTIGGYSYKVFYENLHFGSASSDPGRHIPFALSENGEEVCLTLANGGVLGGYREKEDFGASRGDVSLGRYVKSAASGYDVDFVAMSSRTAGGANSSPEVGFIVISEIMYHPSDPDVNAEYVELVNISGSSVTLFDNTTNEPWKFVDDYKDATPGLEYYFPVGTPVTMAAGEHILLVKDITAYTAKFGVPSVQTFAWNIGSLANAGERLQLSMPGDLNGQGVRQYIRVDRVNFSERLSGSAGRPLADKSGWFWRLLRANEREFLW